MGSFLDKPVTAKETETKKGKLNNEEIGYGVSAMQGWRVNMEDSHIHEIGLEGHPDIAVFGVFDGHGGSMVANHISEHLITELYQNDDFSQVTNASGYDSAVSLGKALRASFLSLDNKMKNLDEVRSGRDHSGSTAVFSFVTPTHYIIGNCGDSRLLICGEDDKVVFSTVDHKPHLPDEQARIEAAGGTVSFRRVNGDLAVSRALGDFVYKSNDTLPNVEQQVSAEPEVTIWERKPTDQFMLVACDGIWDVLSNEAVCKFVLEKIHKDGMPLDLICEVLIDHCLELGSRDNMSVVLVSLPAISSNLGTMSQSEIDKYRKPTVSEPNTPSSAT